MKSSQPGTTYYFVDESGDPTFYDAKGHRIVGEEGCSPILILGFISTNEPQILRQALSRLSAELAADKYLQAVPSMQKSLRAFHAKDDCAEVRQAVFKLIAGLPFKSQFVVARKIERVFTKTFGRDEKKFYDSLIARLFKNALHLREANHIYFAKRGSRQRQQQIETAIRDGIAGFEKRWQTRVTSQVVLQSQSPMGEPCLQIIDYMNWAVYRVFTKQEMRYFDFIKEKVSLVWDIYDTNNYPIIFTTTGTRLIPKN